MAESVKQLRARLQTLQNTRIKDEGALEQAMKRLKTEFSAKDLAAARTLFAKIKASNEKTEKTMAEQADQIDADLTALEQAAAGR